LLQVTPKINRNEYSTKSELVNRIKSRYNIVGMQHTANQLNKRLIKNLKTVAVAESCTGGLTSSLFTRIPGSSRCFTLGIIAYSNKVKVAVLGIPNRIISSKGAVSQEVASLMAKNIRKLGKTDYGIGITGIAGPAGGTPQKPVGTVFIAVDSVNKCVCKRFSFSGGRTTVQRKAAVKTLAMLIRII